MGGLSVANDVRAPILFAVKSEEQPSLPLQGSRRQTVGRPWPRQPRLLPHFRWGRPPSRNCPAQTRWLQPGPPNPPMDLWRPFAEGLRRGPALSVIALSPLHRSNWSRHLPSPSLTLLSI